MPRIMIYEFSVPEMVMQNPNELPLLTGRHLMVPVVNCPRPEKGDRCVIEVCESCESKKDILPYFVDCNYISSQKEKDEIERRRKGIGVAKPTSTVEPKDPGQPKNVFIPKK